MSETEKAKHFSTDFSPKRNRKASEEENERPAVLSHINSSQLLTEAIFTLTRAFAVCVFPGGSARKWIKRKSTHIASLARCAWNPSFPFSSLPIFSSLPHSLRSHLTALRWIEIYYKIYRFSPVRVEKKKKEIFPRERSVCICEFFRAFHVDSGCSASLNHTLWLRYMWTTSWRAREFIMYA